MSNDVCYQNLQPLFIRLPIAVSYTHLDVYKRQGKQFCEAIVVSGDGCETFFVLLAFLQ